MGTAATPEEFKDIEKLKSEVKDIILKKLMLKLILSELNISMCTFLCISQNNYHSIHHQQGTMPHRRSHLDAVNIDTDQMDESKIDATCIKSVIIGFYSCKFF